MKYEITRDMLDNSNSFIFFENQKYSYRDFLSIIDEHIPLLGYTSVFFLRIEPCIRSLALFFACLLEKKHIVLLSPYDKDIPKEHLINNHHSSPTISIGTSGTTKRKFCIHTLETLYSSCSSSEKAFSYTQNDIWEITLPLWHVAGIMAILRMFYIKGSILLPSNTLHDTIKPTVGSFVHTQVFRKLKEDSNYFDRYSLIIIGGDATSLELQCSLKKWRNNVFYVYGMTETAAHVLISRDGKYYQPVDGVKAQISNGELQISSPSLFCGYIGKKQEDTLLFSTGDRATYCKKGIAINGRKGLFIQKGGELLSCTEIEGFLKKTRIFHSVFVRAAQSEEYGEVAIAFVDPLTDIEAVQKAWTGPRFLLPSFFIQLPEYEGIKPSFSLLQTAAMSRGALLVQKAVDETCQ